ncbi:MFS transporter [Aestuariibacter sp. GS-14]|uniref:AmpG family muropeptide MFS transporter n=1 Tax=Aestuariibacter sp. GS-14 TaxID=2590670 RepID=UPI002101E9D1|nr:MFS transporter [Aestuariibacter sp. GS-14]
MSSTFATFRDKRLISIFLFGIASGFPWLMIGSVLSAWLKDESLSRSAIGLFGAIFAVYSFNWLWAPLIDRVKPFCLGQRRGWIGQMQLLIIGFCAWMSTLNAQTDLFLIALCGLLIAIASATQDIAIDAYRIDVIGEQEKATMSAASSLATAGWWTGYGGLGAIPFLLADLPGWHWQAIYQVLAAIMALCFLATLLASEPDIDREALLQDAKARYSNLLGNAQSVTSALSAWLLITLVEPFREFFQRSGARLALKLLCFIFLFKIGEAFLGRMSIVFYKELGFSNTDIGTYSKLLNWWVTIIFSVLGGMVNIRYGIFKGLLIAGIAMAASNLLFALMAVVGPHKGWFVVTIVLDGFTSAWSTVAMVAFISLLCNRAFSATQYALMASLSVLSRTLLASGSGMLVDGLGGNWALFFVITALMVIPSLIILTSLKDKIAEVETSR